MLEAACHVLDRLLSAAASMATPSVPLWEELASCGIVYGLTRALTKVHRHKRGVSGTTAGVPESAVVALDVPQSPSPADVVMDVDIALHASSALLHTLRCAISASASSLGSAAGEVILAHVTSAGTREAVRALQCRLRGGASTLGVPAHICSQEEALAQTLRDIDDVLRPVV